MLLFALSLGPRADGASMRPRTDRDRDTAERRARREQRRAESRTTASEHTFAWVGGDDSDDDANRATEFNLNKLYTTSKPR